MNYQIPKSSRKPDRIECGGCQRTTSAVPVMMSTQLHLQGWRYVKDVGSIVCSVCKDDVEADRLEVITAQCSIPVAAAIVKQTR